MVVTERAAVRCGRLEQGQWRAGWRLWHGRGGAVEQMGANQVAGVVEGVAMSAPAPGLTRRSTGRSTAQPLLKQNRSSRAARALLLPRSALHQSRNHHRPERPRQHLDSAGRLHHHLAHGHDGLHHARRAGQRHLQPQSLPGFLRRSRPAGHAHPGRPRFHSRGRLQLLRPRGDVEPATAAGRLVLAGGRRSAKNRRGRFRPRGRRRSSRSKPSASANSSSRSRPA